MAHIPMLLLAPSWSVLFTKTKKKINFFLKNNMKFLENKWFLLICKFQGKVLNESMPFVLELC